MKRKKLTPTTYILITALLGCVYMVGKWVIPPPPAPPEPQKQVVETPKESQVQPSPKERAEAMKQQMQKELVQSKRYAEQTKLENQYTNGKGIDRSDGITPVYFQQTPMGTAGFAKTDADAAQKKEITEKVNKKLAKEFPDSSTSISGPTKSIVPPENNR